jgi:NAD(P)-dependent dehydrogenase (short-subunit alcohol dehydrogenase family)
MRDLNGRVALLTGASSGLGPFIARRLHSEGVRFILRLAAGPSSTGWPTSWSAPEW